ncbi:MAG: hypothetical protein ACT4NL_10185 [Pseudomarimonas sp.]
MRNFFLKSNAITALLLLGVAGSASASGWEVWAEKQGSDRLTVVTSFSGDGELDEAQVDVTLKASFEIIDAQPLMEGAVCVGSSEKGVLRSVPPSGAGTALKSKTTDACMFTVRVTGAKGWSALEMLDKTRPICASSTKGMVDCAASVKLVK